MQFVNKQFSAIEFRSSRAIENEVKQNSGITLSIDCVIFGFDEGALKILVIKSDYDKYKGKFSLLGDLVAPNVDLETAALQVLQKRTSLDTIFLEQVKTYGSVDRHPAGRVVTVAFCALINTDHYKLKIDDNELQWVDFESLSNMAFDHLKIAKDCLIWLQKKLLTEPVAFNLLPNKFSLRELQNLYSVILAEKLDRRNFRKKIQSLGYLVDLNELEKDVTHRPGKLYKFDTSVQRKTAP